MKQVFIGNLSFIQMYVHCKTKTLIIYSVRALIKSLLFVL